MMFDASGKIMHNNNGWHKAANVLFLENPAGVGFSYVADDDNVVKTISEVGEQFWRFTQSFLRVFEDARAFKWWITGESFGGMYVPHIAKHILAHNKNLQSQDIPVQLKGIAVGNGAYFSPYDIPVNWVTYFDKLGLLRQARIRKMLLDLANACSSELSDPDRVKNTDLPHCEQLQNRFTSKAIILAATLGKHCLPTFYDVRVTKCSEADPTDVYQRYTQAYLSRADVQLALHATSTATSWNWLSMVVYQNLFWNGDQPSYEVLPKLIDEIAVLLYNGDKDIICNYVGMENSLDNMVWRKSKGFGNAKTVEFRRGAGNETLVGEYRQARGLSYMKIFDAGHMVPFNQPEGSLLMIQQFLKGNL
jgi:carboxypeptidase C (cathepsin A)